MGVNHSGFSGNARPETTNWEEHGATGDVSTGRRLKYVQEVPTMTVIDEASATTTYIGQSSPGTATSASLWRIRRITSSGTVTTISFAGGEDKFNQVWDNRASLSYS